MFIRTEHHYYYTYLNKNTPLQLSKRVEIACRGIEPLVSSVKGTHLNHSTNGPNSK